MNTSTNSRLMQNTAMTTLAINLSVSTSSYNSLHFALNFGSYNFSVLLKIINTMTATGNNVRTDKCITCYRVNYSLFLPALIIELSYIGINSIRRNLINEVKNIEFLI